MICGWLMVMVLTTNALPQTSHWSQSSGWQPIRSLHPDSSSPIRNARPDSSSTRTFRNVRHSTHEFLQPGVPIKLDPNGESTIVKMSPERSARPSKIIEHFARPSKIIEHFGRSADHQHLARATDHQHLPRPADHQHFSRAPDHQHFARASDHQHLVASRQNAGRVIDNNDRSNSLSLRDSNLRDNSVANKQLQLLEAALSSPRATEHINGKLPRVFIAPSDVPPPPGYVKIPLVSKNERNTAASIPNEGSVLRSQDVLRPGFIRLALPASMSHVSNRIKVVGAADVLAGHITQSAIFTTERPQNSNSQVQGLSRNVNTGKAQFRAKSFASNVNTPEPVLVNTRDSLSQNIPRFSSSRINSLEKDKSISNNKNKLSNKNRNHINSHIVSDTSSKTSDKHRSGFNKRPNVISQSLLTPTSFSDFHPINNDHNNLRIQKERQRNKESLRNQNVLISDANIRQRLPSRNHNTPVSPEGFQIIDRGEHKSLKTVSHLENERSLLPVASTIKNPSQNHDNFQFISFSNRKPTAHENSKINIGSPISVGFLAENNSAIKKDKMTHKHIDTENILDEPGSSVNSEGRISSNLVPTRLPTFNVVSHANLRKSNTRNRVEGTVRKHEQPLVEESVRIQKPNENNILRQINTVQPDFYTVTESADIQPSTVPNIFSREYFSNEPSVLTTSDQFYEDTSPPSISEYDSTSIPLFNSFESQSDLNNFESIKNSELSGNKIRRPSLKKDLLDEETIETTESSIIYTTNEITSRTLQPRIIHTTQKPTPHLSPIPVIDLFDKNGVGSTSPEALSDSPIKDVFVSSNNKFTKSLKVSTTLIPVPVTEPPTENIATSVQKSEKPFSNDEPEITTEYYDNVTEPPTTTGKETTTIFPPFPAIKSRKNSRNNSRSRPKSPFGRRLRPRARNPNASATDMTKIQRNRHTALRSNRRLSTRARQKITETTTSHLEEPSKKTIISKKDVGEKKILKRLRNGKLRRMRPEGSRVPEWVKDRRRKLRRKLAEKRLNVSEKPKENLDTAESVIISITELPNTITELNKAESEITSTENPESTTLLTELTNVSRSIPRNMKVKNVQFSNQGGFRFSPSSLEKSTDMPLEILSIADGITASERMDVEVPEIEPVSPRTVEDGLRDAEETNFSLFDAVDENFTEKNFLIVENINITNKNFGAGVSDNKVIARIGSQPVVSSEAPMPMVVTSVPFIPRPTQGTEIPSHEETTEIPTINDTEKSTTIEGSFPIEDSTIADGPMNGSVLGQSTILEVRSSQPKICFDDGRCIFVDHLIAKNA